MYLNLAYVYINAHQQLKYLQIHSGTEKGHTRFSIVQHNSYIILHSLQCDNDNYYCNKIKLVAKLGCKAMAI